MAVVKYLNEALNRKPNIISLFYDESMGFDEYELEDNMIEEDELMAQIGNVISKSDIRPGRSKEINHVLYDISNADVAGILYDSIDGDTYSFDIVVNGAYQGQGFGKTMVDSAISNYNDAKDAYEDLKMIADVVNPQMERILASKNFEVINKRPGHTYMQYKG